MIVMLIGLAALLASGSAHQTGEAGHRATDARYLAHAAIELALHRINTDPAWRSNHSSGQWSDPEPLGAGAVRYRLVAADGAAFSDPHSHVWLEGEGSVKEAVRITRVALQPALQMPGINLIRNPQAHDGTRHWRADREEDRLEFATADKQVGDGAIHLRSFADNDTRLEQDVTDRIVNGQAYQLRLALRLVDTPRRVRLRIRTVNTAGVAQTASHDLGTLDLEWAYHTAVLTPQWDGVLEMAMVQVRADDPTSFLVDDVSLIRVDALHAMVVVPGTWQQVVR